MKERNNTMNFKEIFDENNKMIQEKEEQIKKYESEKEQLLRRLNRIEINVERKKKIIAKRTAENNFMENNNLI